MNSIFRAVAAAARLALFVGLLSASVHGQAVMQQWARVFNGAENRNDVGYAVALDAAGNVFVAGQLHYATGDSDAYLTKYSAGTGAPLWQKSRPGPGGHTNSFKAAAVDAAGNVVATGYSNNGFHYDIYTAKYDGQTGALMWERGYDGPDHGNDFGFAVAIDGAGNVVVGGQSASFGNSGDYYTAKYAAADGALIWEQRYNGPGNNSDVIVAVGLDAAGNAFVTGSSPTPTGTDLYTVKYAAANGGVLWSMRTDGTPFNYYYSEAAGLAVDSAGNVVVTGRFVPSSGTDDIWTLKYAASNGAILWNRRVANASYDFPGAIGLDSADNVFITGTTYSTFTGAKRIYTAKYAAATGAVQWESFDGSTTSGENKGLLLAMDPAGNPVVAGTTFGATPEDFRVIKYSNGGGAVLWSANYNGPGNVADIPWGMAVDRNGHAVVTGQTNNFGTSNGLNIATIKLADGPYSETQAADQIAQSGARLNATVNPNGFTTTAAFEYATNAALSGANSAAVGNPGSGTAGVPVLATIAGLSPSTTYYYRAVAAGNGKTARGSVLSFTTLPDTTPPLLNLPAPIVVSTGNPAGAVVNYTATTSDPGGSGVATSSFIPPSGSMFPVGVTTVTATATDNAGNTASGSFTVTVNYNPPPTGGTFAVTPNTGVRQGDALTLVAAGWTDPDLPLTYQFFLNSSLLNAVGATATLNINAPTSGTYTLKVRVTDSAGSFTDASEPLTVIAFTPIESWRYSHFNSYANTGDAADNADWDHDGIPNGMEFAFGTDPTSGASGPGALQFTGTFAGGGTIAATGQPITRSQPIAGGVDFRALFVRRVGYLAAGVTYTPEFSADMMAWQPSVAVPSVLADNGTLQIVSVSYPFFIAGKKALNFRVRVTTAP